MQRRAIVLLREVFGLGDSYRERYLDHTCVRVGIDLLADAVEKRFGRARQDS